MAAADAWIVPDPEPRDPDHRDPVGGDVADFEALYRQEYPRLVAVAHGLTGRRAVAEELVQEAFVRAHQRWDRVGRMDRPSSWVRRVVVNLATSRARRAMVEARYLAGIRPAAEPPLEAETVEFWRLIRRLPPRQRVVAALYYADDLDTVTIAEVLGRAPGTVRAQLHTARRTLARELGADVPTDDPPTTDPRGAQP